jgi:hypothetical protein
MVLNVLRRVFRHSRYIAVVIGVAVTVVTAALLLPNKTVIYQVVTSSSVGLSSKLSFVISLFGSLGSNFTVLSASYLVTVAVLFGLNIALLIFYIRRRQEVLPSKKAHLATVGGMMSAVLGIGCAACGSVVLTAVFGLVGAGGLLVWLPLHGLEFGIAGTLLLLISIRYLIKKINHPLVCPIKL